MITWRKSKRRRLKQPGRRSGCFGDQQQYLYSGLIPVLHATQGITMCGNLPGVVTPGTPAILYAASGKGEVIPPMPTVGAAKYVSTGLRCFVHCHERAGRSFRSVKPGVSAAVADDVIPAYEAGVPVRVTNKLLDYWDKDLKNVTITETVKAGFVVQLAIFPSSASMTSGINGTTIVWNFTGAVLWNDHDELHGADVDGYTRQRSGGAEYGAGDLYRPVDRAEAFHRARYAQFALQNGGAPEWRPGY